MAVAAAYAASGDVEPRRFDGGTDWEVYQRVRDQGSDELAERFRRLTESYEATQYGGILPGTNRLEDLLKDAGFVVSNTDDEDRRQEGEVPMPTDGGLISRVPRYTFRHSFRPPRKTR